MTTAEAIKELMDKYNEYRTKWIAFHGNDKGFNDWFSTKI